MGARGSDSRARDAADLVVITRDFSAPRELVFDAWSSAASLERWYAPVGCTLKVYSLDFRAQGAFHTGIIAPGGYECVVRGVYEEIVRPERIVFSMWNANSAGDPVEPAEIGMDPEWPRETRLTVTFEEIGKKTRMTLEQTVRREVAERTGAYPSWLQMLDRLEDLVASAGV